MRRSRRTSQESDICRGSRENLRAFASVANAWAYPRISLPTPQVDGEIVRCFYLFEVSEMPKDTCTIPGARFMPQVLHVCSRATDSTSPGSGVFDQADASGDDKLIDITAFPSR